MNENKMEELCCEERSPLVECVEQSEELVNIVRELHSLVDSKVNRIVGEEPECVDNACKEVDTEPYTDVAKMNANFVKMRSNLGAMVNKLHRL